MRPSASAQFSLIKSGNQKRECSKKKEEKEDEDGDTYHSERSYGCFHRAVALPQGIDGDNARVSFKKGVLKVTIPKNPETRNNRRKIKLIED